MKITIFANITTLVFLSAASSAYAGLTPDSYSMLNGNTDSSNYWDETYTGSGCVTCDNAALTGGRGDLTDGMSRPTTCLSPKHLLGMDLM